MKRSWSVRRTVQPLPNGDQRWDRAFQLLLRWAHDADIARAAQAVVPKNRTQEASDESSDLCPRVDATAGSESIH